MAQSGYGYDPLHGYHPQAPYVHQPYPSYLASTHSYPNGPVRTIVHNEPAPRDPYNPHNVIPGLGLNISQNAAQWPAPWANQQLPSGQAPPAAPGQNGPSRRTDKREEGEVSEGEVDDVYEPRGAEVIADLPYMHGDAGYSAGFSNANGKQEVADDPSAAFAVGRDPSGSYSPYLSSQELDHQTTAGSPGKPQPNPPKSTPSSPKISGSNHTTSNQSSVKSVAAARKQARDAIQRLWPLNVRYQNYIDEGIDKTLVGGLFEELGFDKALSSTIAATDSGHAQEATSEAKDEILRTVQTDAEENPASVPVKDKSEERKDRIARLLAAKNSKPSTSVTGSSAPTHLPGVVPAPAPSSHTPVTRPHGAVKTQSEKSKLLHQKMEALRKARELEARGQKRPHPDIPTRQNLQVRDEADGSIDTATSGMHFVSREHTPSQSESPDGQPPPSIPGLFLSSTPQPSHSEQILNLERPASTSLLDSNPRPFKRPFGQTRRSRPILIDVSDDEDGTEMDIDSPEQKVVSLASRPNPTLKTSISLRSIPPATDNAAAVQQYSSLTTTPPGSGSDTHARDNLDNMNKKIEAMKRRIAEAEARKKAKQSRPASPALPTLNAFPNSSFEAAIANKETVLHMSSSVEPRELPHSTPSIAGLSPGMLYQLSESSPRSGNERRRSRSRAASERLPVIEARRREQQRELQLLQAQVANIQLEIQRTLEEEEKLKMDAGTESDYEHTQEQPALTLPKPPVPSSPFTDAMDISSISPQSNNTGQHGRGASLREIEESQQEQETSVLTPAQAEQSLPTDRLTTPQAANITTIIVDNGGQETIQSAMPTKDDANTAAEVEEPQNMPISEAGDSNNADSDDYEPPDVELPSPSRNILPEPNPSGPAPAELVPILETSPNGIRDQDNTTDTISTQQISAVQQDTASESGREVDAAQHVKDRPLHLTVNQVDQVSEALAAPAPAPDTLQTTFVPYESPLRYFRAYRFHPEYSQSVAGGLRSLTFSNKIDVKKEICPEELANNSCPRGKDCEFQHFESMQAPDDQILLQLGAHSDIEEQKKHEYINGLRQLLTDFRNRKVKDFQTISQSIIDYRAQFLGDKSKILPLGGVTI